MCCLVLARENFTLTFTVDWGIRQQGAVKWGVCALLSGWLMLQTHTQNIQYLSFSTAMMVKRTSFSVSLHVNCPRCLSPPLSILYYQSPPGISRNLYKRSLVLLPLSIGRNLPREFIPNDVFFNICKLLIFLLVRLPHKEINIQTFDLFNVTYPRYRRSLRQNRSLYFCHRL